VYCLFCFVFFCSVSFDAAALRNGRRSRSTNDRIVSAARSHIAVVPRRQRTIFRATDYLYRINIGLPRKISTDAIHQCMYLHIPTRSKATWLVLYHFGGRVLGRNRVRMIFRLLQITRHPRGSPWTWQYTDLSLRGLWCYVLLR